MVVIQGGTGKANRLSSTQQAACVSKLTPRSQTMEQTAFGFPVFEQLIYYLQFLNMISDDTLCELSLITHFTTKHTHTHTHTHNSYDFSSLITLHGE